MTLEEKLHKLQFEAMIYHKMVASLFLAGVISLIHRIKTFKLFLEGEE